MRPRQVARSLDRKSARRETSSSFFSPWPSATLSPLGPRPSGRGTSGGPRARRRGGGPGRWRAPSGEGSTTSDGDAAAARRSTEVSLLLFRRRRGSSSARCHRSRGVEGHPTSAGDVYEGPEIGAKLERAKSGERSESEERRTPREREKSESGLHLGLLFPPSAPATSFFSFFFQSFSLHLQGKRDSRFLSLRAGG